jgi:DNA-binding LacI/PurR family transcriptional regulator
MAALCIPALTTVRQPKYEMGEHSVRRLLSRIESSLKGLPAEETETTALKTEIIMRESVSPCGNSADRELAKQ